GNPSAVAPGRPAPSVPRVVTPPPPQGAAPNQASGDGDTTLQFPNSDVQDVLRFYESLTGKKLIMDNFVTGKVSIFVSKKVPRDEAIKIIEMSLLLNGYSLVPAGDDIVKVIGTGKNPRTTGVPIISDESEIPEGDHVISYLFKLRYADPQELLQALGQYLSPPQPYTSFLALPKAGAILVTENSSVIRTLAKIIDQVDQPPAEVVSEFIKLERADASKVVDMLKDVFEKTEKATQPGQPGYRPGVRPVGSVQIQVPPQGQETSELAGLTALTEESVIVGKIKLEADVRTNRIHVITRPVNMPFVRKLVAEFDANVEFAKPVTRALRYISATDVLPVLVQALTEPGQAGGGAEGAAGGGQPGASPHQQKTTTATASSGGVASSTTSTSGGYGGGSSGGSLNVSEELETQAVDTTPKSVTVGNAKIIADPRANTIITLGNQEVVVKVQKVLDEMDVKAPQVALTTVIGELTLSNDEELGVDWFGKYKGKLVGISRNTGAPIPQATAASTAAPGATPVIVPGVVDPAGLVNFGQALAQVAGGTNIYVAAGNYLAAIVHTLESTGKFKVISRPMVFTSNNKKAIIASGQEVPIPVNTLSNVANTGVTTSTGTAAVASNIEYKKVALQLEVVPLINSEKEVSLDILQKIDSLVAGGNVNIGGNTVPTIATRYIKTNVTAANGSTIVLGGLIQDNKQKSFSGIPVLDKIPYLGAAFRSTTYTRMRTELIVLMCPEVTLTKLDLLRLREKNEDKTHFGPELDQEGCPDCPPSSIEEKQLDKQLPPPDLPFGKETTKAH
ncbi:MAG TPA: secretin N-terminal domain-containing protein, partial [Chthoniobacterales bacterium]|nr:secretin N-terminal domain-containing protein [Chthoniobacterales bacterium]